MKRYDEDRFLDKRDAPYVEQAPTPEVQESIVCAVTTYRRRLNLNVNDPIPAISLTRLGDRETINLASLAGSLPLVLIFGSYT